MWPLGFCFLPRQASPQELISVWYFRRSGSVDSVMLVKKCKSVVLGALDALVSTSYVGYENEHSVLADKSPCIKL